MTSMTLDSIVHLLAGEVLTAQREPTRASHRAWASVVHLGPRKTVYLNSANPAELGPLEIVSFEVLLELLENEAIDIEETECTEFRSTTVAGAPEAEAALLELGVDPSKLAFKSSTGYPL